jgi:hypothetical protein
VEVAHAWVVVSRLSSRVGGKEIHDLVAALAALAEATEAAEG